MRINPRLTTFTALTSAAALVSGAELTEAQRLKIEQKAAGTYNPLSFFDGKVVLDVQERLRVEVRENNFDFDNDVRRSTDDTFLLQRFRLGVTLKPAPWFKAYVQGQDSREIDSKRENVPFVSGAEGDDPFDLRQGYFELGDHTQFPLSAKIGRQEFIYGDERVIGAFDWNNFSRTFDALKVRYSTNPQKFWLDAFVSHVVTIEGVGPGENYGYRFNRSNWEDTFAGLYGSCNGLPFQNTEAYFLMRNKRDNDPLYRDVLGNRARAYDIKQEIYTFGLRGKSTPGTLHGFDYEYEGAYQFGRAAGRIGPDYPNPAGIAQDHNAWAAMVRAGYTWSDFSWSPRLGMEYSVGSGDCDPNDNKNESFLNLFPTNHKFYGYMDLFSWKNIHNPSVSLKLAPHPKVTLQLDGHAFWLYTNEDAWYRANAVATVRPLSRDANTFVGTEADLTIGYTPAKWLRFLAGYSHFFSGDYIRETGAGSDADFGFVQAMLTF